MLASEQRAAMAQALFNAEAEHTPIEPFTITHPDADIEDSYRIAQLVTELKVAAGRSVKGHKVGLTSKAMQQLSGASEPDYGTLTDDWIVPEGSVIDMTRLNRPLVEVEIAFVLGHDLSGPGVNAADVIRATDFVLPAIEIVDSRYRGRGPKPLIDSVVLSGSFVKAIPFRAGDTIAAMFNTLGDVTFATTGPALETDQ
jgi:2-oxo-hept-3-ene-1,7-dioate hydratase